MNRSSIYGIALVAAGILAAFVFVPTMRASFWVAIAWTIFLMSSTVALVVVGNILSVLYHMHFGYDSERDETENALEGIRKQIPGTGSPAKPIAPRRVA